MIMGKRDIVRNLQSTLIKLSQAYVELNGNNKPLDVRKK